MQRRADLVMRCAWLRGAAYALFAAEEAGEPVVLCPRNAGEIGLLAAQLRDLADMLEVGEKGRWLDGGDRS